MNNEGVVVSLASAQGTSFPTMMVEDKALSSLSETDGDSSRACPTKASTDEQSLKAAAAAFLDARHVSNAEREKHIASCAWLMEDAMSRYYESGCFSHRGEADRWRLLMEEAIKSRPAAYVAKLEAKRGLR